MEMVQSQLPQVPKSSMGKEGAGDFVWGADFRCGCRLILEGPDIQTESSWPGWN